jgi:hypothetical protein
MNNHQKSMMGNYLKHNPVVAVAIILLVEETFDLQQATDNLLSSF